MIGQYLFPNLDITFEKFAEISDWKRGYVVWGFPVWKWLMDHGAYITDFDTVDYEAFASEGVAGLKRTAAPAEFEYVEKNTYNLELESKRVKQALSHSNFTYIRRKTVWNDVLEEFNKPGICELTLNSRALKRESGFVLHRVVLIDITNTKVVFHDPNEDSSGAYRREPLEHFRKVFESADGPELARYSLEKK